MTLLTDKEQQQVAAAISEVERETDAELVTVLADTSDNYAYIPLLWAGIIALLLPGAINYFTGSLSADWLLVVQWATFIVLCLLLQFPGVGHHLIPRQVRYWRASNMARRQFLEQNLHHTEGGVGMLVFVSEAEHYVEILVDQGISSRVGDDVWEGIVKTFTDRVRSGDTLTGFLECIDSCGQHLREQVPATHEKNELPNHLVLIPKRS
ncbi:TPM domain-containing protein [Marinobacter orientalis]|uniref:TPM domain-containing protein n=1 Tax=Marinobacter orientalis TaxID=1928859 RepID=A0A7Y0RE03_9GAMM|nr:TPM domain-containing protein [Marinobacter orientalis]NMT64492.1 hypothetical protein [Marinobacter orientalis]TGX50552.1 hypothetical protein DIT72_00400 [Marinobacter orientalis]